MSDPTDGTTEATTPDNGKAAESVQQPKPRPTSAASRARRIGGRTTATPAPSGSRGTGDPSATTTADSADQEASSDTSEAVKAAVDDAVRGARPRLRKTPPATDRAEAPADSSKEAPEDPAETKEPTAAGAGRSATLLNWLPAAVLLAGVMAMAVVVIVVSHGVWWGKRQQGADNTNLLRERVTAAAKTCMARLNSYDYRTLDSFAKAGSTCATGQELTKFEQAVTDVLKKQAPVVKGTQSLQINTTGIESVVGDQWTLLVYGQVKVTNVAAPKGRIDPFAASITMDKVHGKWLVSNQQLVSGLG